MEAPSKLVKSSKSISERERKQTIIDEYFKGFWGNALTEIGLNLVESYLDESKLLQQQKQENKNKKSRKHAKMTTPSSIKCRSCEFVTDSSLVMAQHYEIPHLKESEYWCNFCSEKSINPQEILDHTQMVHGINSHIEESREHIKMTTLPSILCKDCEFVTDSFHVVAQHYVIPHLKESEYWCNLCSKKSIYSKEILDHMSREHGVIAHIEKSCKNMDITTIPSIKCRVCKFGTDSSIVMAHHYETPHFKNSEYWCNFCSEKSIDCQKILSHMQMEHGIKGHIEKPLKSYPCPNCPWETTRRGQLRSHRVRCDAKFDLKQNLAPSLDYHDLPAYTHNRGKKNKMHQQKPIKSGKVTKKSKRLSPKPKEVASPSSIDDSMDIDMQPSFVECEICDEKIANMESLYDHIKVIHKEIISKEKVVQRNPSNDCKICEPKIWFYSKGGLERHYLGTHNSVTRKLEIAYKNNKDCGCCPICRESFNSGLVDHFLEEHNNELQTIIINYKCPLCNEIFPFMKDYNIHVRSVHGSS